MTALTYTISDQPWIDALRGFIVIAAILLALAAPAAAIRYRRNLPRRVVSLLIVLVCADAYIGGTEAQQIGQRMLVWRLPLGFAVILGAIAYIARMSVAVEGHEPIR